jgi:hypothetical protein
MLCAVLPLPRPHPCCPPTMSHPKPFSPLTPIITPTHPPRSSTHQLGAVEDRHQPARAPCSLNGTNSVTFSAYATTRSGLSATPPPGGPLRARPDFPAPADLAAGEGPAVRDAFKRATDVRASWLACSAAFCAGILHSIGESNRLAISDPDTDTLHLSTRDIINARTALHGTMTGADIINAMTIPQGVYL